MDSVSEPQYRIDGSCWRFLPVNSDGFWNLKPGENIIAQYPLLLLQIQLVVIFILTSTIHFFLRRVHFPRLVSEFLVGLFLGHSFLERFYPNISRTLFPISSLKVLVTFTKFGYLFFMFIIGVKMDVKQLMKSGKRGWTIGSITYLFAFCVNVPVAKYIGVERDNVNPIQITWVLIISGTLMITSFPVVACLLMHLRIINSELGHLALSSALVADLISLVVINLQAWSHLLELSSLHVTLKSMFLSITLVVFILTVLRPMMFWIIRRTPEGKPVKDSYVYVVFVVLLLVAITGENVGLQFLYGPFILGLAVPTGPPLASALVEKLDAIISGLMLPLLSTLCGYKSNLWELKSRPPAYFVYISTFGFLAKVTASFLSAICFKMPRKDAAALALILTAKGAVELSIISFAADKMVRTKDLSSAFHWTRLLTLRSYLTFLTALSQVAPSDQYTMAALVVPLVAAVVPVLVRKLHDPSNTYAGYQKRTILNSCISDGLRVLACAQRQDDALAAIKLLEISNPSKESPISVSGLYLEELKGGSTPLLLNHQLGQKSSCSDGSRWQPIIDVFNYFKSQHKKLVNVQVFTAISPAKLMHEDICWVAFANSVVLIILPFHKKWNIKGMIIADSKDLRTLNSNVLKKAPCSVGILIDRSRARSSSIFASSLSYQVGVIYIGGDDDREALALARRMIGCAAVHITIFRLISLNDDNKKEWENILDHEAFREFKYEASKNENITYEDVNVEDAAYTTSFIGSILENDNFDLILVGRRHESSSRITAGLSEWSELPELGPIGDLLVSSDISSTVSVLVVQQQIIKG
ncbi:hypothetical protein SLA2020_504000 [Shorea laevis]